MSVGGVVKVKVFHGADIRRVDLPHAAQQSLDGARAWLASTLGLDSRTPVQVRYRDDDQDWISVVTPQDWVQAMAFASARGTAGAPLSLSATVPAPAAAVAAASAAGAWAQAAVGKGAAVGAAGAGAGAKVAVTAAAKGAAAGDAKGTAMGAAGVTAAKQQDVKQQPQQPQAQAQQQPALMGRAGIMNSVLRNRPKGQWPVQSDVKFPPVIRVSKAVGAAAAPAPAQAAAAADEWTLVDDDDFAGAAAGGESKAKTKAAAPAAVATAAVPFARATFQVPKALSARFTNTLTFTLNGKVQNIVNPSPSAKLVNYIRNDAGLTGTKIGCGEGGCGACTVVVQYTNTNGQQVIVPVNSCLKPLCAVAGMQVWTTEGIGSVAQGLDSVQAAIALGGNPQSIATNETGSGTQCGYCTVGFVMNMYGLMQQTHNAPTPDQVEQQFSGNICRCTGYRPIFAGFQTLAKAGAESKAKRNAAAAGATCCKGTGGDSKARAACDSKTFDPAARTGAGHKTGCTGSCGSCSHNTTGCCQDIEDLGKTALTKTGILKPSYARRHSGSGNGADEQNLAAAPARQSLYFVDDTGAWFAPTTINDLYTLLATYAPNTVRLVVGNTSPAVQKYYRHNSSTDSPSVFIDVTAIPDLNVTTQDNSYVYIGAAQTLSDVIAILTQVQGADPTNPKWRHFTALIRHFSDVANSQVRNAASWAGNLMMAKGHPNFPSDLLTVLTAVGAAIHTQTMTNGQWINIGPDFLNYNFAQGEVIVTLRIPFFDDTQTFDSFKVAARAQNAHALVNAAFYIKYDGSVGGSAAPAKAAVAAVAVDSKVAAAAAAASADEKKTVAVVSPLGSSQTYSIARGTPHAASKLYVPPKKAGAAGAGDVKLNVVVTESKAKAVAAAVSAGAGAAPNIVSVTMVYGNIQPSALMLASQTMAALIGKPLSAATLAAALPILDTECTPTTDPTDPTWLIVDPAYRRSLGTTLFFKHWLAQMVMSGQTIPADLVTAASRYNRPNSTATQSFTPAGNAPIGVAVPKLEGQIQASGEAKYACDNTPGYGLCGAYVTSTQWSGTIVSIDASAALAMSGVVDILTAADIALMGGSNNCGAFPGDEEIFASKEVFFVHQAVGFIVADTQQHADEAAKAVVVTYGPPSTNAAPLFNLDDAITANSIFAGNTYQQPPPPVTQGQPASAYASAKYQYTGTFESGTQYHFFMETHSAYATPLAQGRFHVYSSSQGTSAVRAALVTALNTTANKISVETAHTGGGFGGKLTRNWPIACAVTFAAKKLGKPVRCQLARQVDMNMWAKRHPFRCDYQIGIDASNKIQALIMNFKINGGHTYDAVYGIMSMCLNWSDNTYYIPNFLAQGISFRTNMATNTPMRAPGVLHSVWIIEAIVENAAAQLGLDPKVLREANFYANGNSTPYNQTIQYITLPQIWAQLQTQANYSAKVTSVAAFNAANRWRKQGVHMTPVKYGMSVAGYNAGVLVNVCVEDGTVQVTQTGCEIGQGINTKVAQSVAQALGMTDTSLIQMMPARSDVIPNSGETGGSGTSESNAQAAQLACTPIMQAIAAAKAALPPTPAPTWPQLVTQAFNMGLNLQGSGCFTYPGNPNNAQFTYWVWAAACSVVELDVLSGQVQILQTDIVYDNGNSLNPCVDIGQIEGAFVMGLGFFFTEDVITNQDKGYIINNGTWDYKPFSSLDIPQQLNVTLLANTPNADPNAVLKSKATGEPPVQLAASAFFALQDAIKAARVASGNNALFTMNAPMTVEKTQRLCGVAYQQLTVT